MDDLSLSLGFLIWIVIIVSTIIIYDYYSNKYDKLLVLIPVVIIPVWIIAAILQGLINFYIDNSTEVFTSMGIYLMADTFAHVLLFGSITFALKYLQFKKNRNKVNGNTIHKNITGDNPDNPVKESKPNQSSQTISYFLISLFIGIGVYALLSITGIVDGLENSETLKTSAMMVIFFACFVLFAINKKS